MNESISDKRYTLGLLLGLRTPFYLTIQGGAQVEAAARGVALLTDAPSEWGAVYQIPLVDRFIAGKVDALIVTPSDGRALIEPLGRAHEAGIPIITVDAFLGDGDYAHGTVTFPLAYIGSDNRQGGRIAGELLLQAIGGSGAVCIQSLQPGVSATDLREAGCQEVIAATGEAVHLVGVNFDGGSISRAREQMLATFERHPQLTGVIATGDYSARGLVQAVRDAGKEGQIKIVRFDASEQAEGELRNGITQAVIAQRPFQMGSLAVEYVIKHLQGEGAGLTKYVDTGFMILDQNTIDLPESLAAVYRVGR